jgi:circadian clock protein KaiC
LGTTSVLTGSARLAKEAEDQAAASLRAYEIEQKKALRESRRRAFERRLAALRDEFAAENVEIERAIHELEVLEQRTETDRTAMARSRRAFAGTVGNRKRMGKDARR